MYVKGESEMMEGTETKYFPLYPERTHNDSAEQRHFRLAESQFYRLLDSDKYRVTCVEYCVCPSLVKKFKDAREVLEKKKIEFDEKQKKDEGKKI